MAVNVEFDPVKNERNIRERGLSFERVVDFDFVTAAFAMDSRRDYGEVRHIAAGYLDGRLHVLCFALKHDALRVISFRKANKREANRYGKPQTLD